jgi:hypothetical protein
VKTVYKKKIKGFVYIESSLFILHIEILLPSTAWNFIEQLLSWHAAVDLTALS